MSNYDPKTREAHWQKHWEDAGTYHFRDDQPQETTFTIDTPPPTVSGVLHMGHIFSYTQADFIARYKRMCGYDVFYPMGFDDNGLPTERLVEKTKKIRAHQYISEHGREAFVDLCQDVVDEAEAEFKRLFQSVALSVDWNQLYQTISDEVTALSQASFLDLIEKGQAYRDFRPTYWDWTDQTAIASAEIEEQELPGIQCHIPFGIMGADDWKVCADQPDHPRPEFDALEQVLAMTTRPELLGACVALMIHPDDAEKYKGKVAVSPLFNVVVPIVADEKVDKEKGTGFVMCCSWGDDTDKEWIQQHGLSWRPLVGMDGKLNSYFTDEVEIENTKISPHINFHAEKTGSGFEFTYPEINNENCFDVRKAAVIYETLNGSKLIRDINNENSAKGIALKLLEEANLLREVPPPAGGRLGGGHGELGAKTSPLPNPPPTGEGMVVKKTQTVKCAERSGKPIEIIPTYQWFVRITDKKDAIKEKAAECDWNPEYMRVRLNQWTDNLKEDWCISRQRFFGVPFPVWYVNESSGKNPRKLYPKLSELPIDPISTPPSGFTITGKLSTSGNNKQFIGWTALDEHGVEHAIMPDQDVMDTWATSSISPQINAKSLHTNKLYPADLRPQAHEIIRTWAFYTIVKSLLHQDTIPWKHLMISGWCLASDKTKMSKSKGNVVTPVELIEDKGADAVRYWASTSRLGADTAFSEDLLKIGKKLVTKLYNASNFAGQHLSKIEAPEFNAEQAIEKGLITETLDKWILTRLYNTVEKATTEFERFEYAAAREHIEHFFWRDFCDNYLELVKARSYGEDFQSAVYTLHYCLNTLCKLFAPFVPHITEELYSTLFPGEYAKTSSVHVRGQWPVKDDFIHNSASETLGEAAVEILEAIRKAKSEASVSIKFPVSHIRIAPAKFKLDIKELESILSDLKAAGSVEHAELLDSLTSGSETELGHFKVEIKLADKEAA